MSPGLPHTLQTMPGLQPGSTIEPWMGAGARVGTVCGAGRSQGEPWRRLQMSGWLAGV